MESKFEASNANFHQLIHAGNRKSPNQQNIQFELLINGHNSRYYRSQLNYQLLVEDLNIQPEAGKLRKIFSIVLFSPVIVLQIFKRTW